MLNKQIIYRVYVYIKSFFFNYMVKDIKILLLNLHKNKIFYQKKVCVFMPKQVKKFAVVRSPFVSKLSKEQFEIRTYKVLLIFKLQNNLVLKKFTKFNLKYSYYKIRYVFLF